MELSCRRAKIPRKSSRFSNEIYPVWTLLILAGLREYENKPYRRFFEWLEVTEQLQRHLELTQLPHYTTLQKFTQRIPPKWIHMLLRSSGDTLEEPAIIAIDSTGFRLDYGSQHYIRRMTHLGVKRFQVKTHLKLTIGVETKSQLVTSCKIRRGPANDNKDFPIVATRAAEATEIATIVADKGYDSEANHKLCREQLGSHTIIPARNQDVPITRTRGRYRKEMKRGYDTKTYNQRNKDETVNSVIKRLMSETIRARKTKTQNRTLGLRIFTYNSQRLARIGA